MRKESPTGCVGATCDWALNAGLQCFEGPGNCKEAAFLEADPSPFHDPTLIKATRKLNRILSGIPKDPEGRKLSFVLSDMGTLLAWVNHSAKKHKHVVTARDPEAIVAKALKLKVPAGGA